MEAKMKIQKIYLAAAICLVTGVAGSLHAYAQTHLPNQVSAVRDPVRAAPVMARNVVLVHGLWADGSSWGKVVTILQAAGLHVMVVQNSVTSLADADAQTRLALAQQNGPTVLVGHSWGGTVISDVGDDPKVSALVYVAARAPDAGKDFATLTAEFPAAPVHTGAVKFRGFTYLTEAAFTDDFANGIPHSQAEVLYAEQEPFGPNLMKARTIAAAWHDKPTFYAVSEQDRTINPDLERFMAKRMNATTIEVNAGHLSMISQPQAIADLILQAAGQGK